MQVKVSDYIADFLAKHGVDTIFTVTGGGAMHMNDSFGHHEKLNCIYNHNEQASAMAAEAYARIDNRIAAVCVTTGPGATNAITGVAGAWMDSIPMLVFSGQARYATTIYASGLPLRTRGVQEFDIIGSVQNMTKYSTLVTDKNRVAYSLEKALYLAQTGRKGPCWLDIPLDIQGAIIETDDLLHYENCDRLNGMEQEIWSEAQKSNLKEKEVKVAELQKNASEIVKRVSAAERPVLIAGNGIRLADAHKEFLELVELLQIPVVDTASSVDAISTEHRLFAGRTGITGTRSGNFAVQNSDLILSLGSRLSYGVTGFQGEMWAREAYVIANDVDAAELEKDNIHADIKVVCDVKVLIAQLIEILHTTETSSGAVELSDKKSWSIKQLERQRWIHQCQQWRRKYPVVQKKHFQDKRPNIYAFYKRLTDKLTAKDCLVVSAGTARVVGSQVASVAEGMRFISNAAMASMGYDLPAAIGACIARKREKTYVCTGDGGLQMNLQELQTIAHHKLPIALFVINNNGYQSIRVTQENFFSGEKVGIGKDSGDISFPELEKLMEAYGIQYKKCERMEQMEETISWAMKQELPCVCELMVSTKQKVEPKVGSKKLANGSMISSPLEDMSPFLSKEELAENMYIPTMEWV